MIFKLFSNYSTKAQASPAMLVLRWVVGSVIVTLFLAN